MKKKINKDPLKIRDNNGRSLAVAIPKASGFTEKDFVNIIQKDADTLIIQRIKKGE